MSKGLMIIKKRPVRKKGTALEINRVRISSPPLNGPISLLIATNVEPPVILKDAK